LQGGTAAATDALAVSPIPALLRPYAVRREIGAGSRLFVIGDPATHYFFVERGSLVLERSRPRRNSNLRFAHPGDLFIFDCGGVHAADCTALGSTRLLSIERRRVENAARIDPALGQAVQAAHARELGLILQTLGVEHTGQPRPAQAQTAAGTELLKHALWNGLLQARQHQRLQRSARSA